MKDKCNVAIIGSTGYTGRELTKLARQHPYINLLPLTKIEECLQNSHELNTVFLATPTNVSIEAVAALIETNASIIDLSGAFRLPHQLFNQWYGIQHNASWLIEKACYGLCPWTTLQPTTQLIANPGCYATAALMALIPLVKETLIDTQSIIIDAKSGVSGSGKKPSEELLFCEIANNFYPYKIGTHQHTPEIELALEQYNKVNAKISLTTSMLPLIRGLSMNIYLKAAPSFSSDKEVVAALFNAYQKHYKNYPLVRFQEVGVGAIAEDKKFLGLQQVIHTPYCHIGFFVKEGQIILFSSIDNLLKGAASQAIENLNALNQLPLHTGLAF